jgi:uncharacterized protein (DUF983 family)
MEQDSIVQLPLLFGFKCQFLTFILIFFVFVAGRVWVNRVAKSSIAASLLVWSASVVCDSLTRTDLIGYYYYYYYYHYY